MQDRYDRLIALQERITLEENEKLVGRTVEVLVTEGDGRKNAATRRRSGRAEDGRLVHFEVPLAAEGATAAESQPRPGDVVTVEITHAAPHHLIADSIDGAPLRIRRTRSGDAYERGQSGEPEHSHAHAHVAAGAVSLGLPTVR